MKVINSFLIAFSMYSKIPMPKADWSKENMKYVMCFFPWVGAVIGGLYAVWGIFGRQLFCDSALHTVILMLIPVAVTGGIHLDGLLDTIDALSSYQSRERRLEILKDSHAGAFAIIGCIVYFFLYYGCLRELSVKGIPVLALGFFFTRALSGLSIAAFPCAKNSGLAATFSENAHRKRTGILLGIQGALCAVVMILVYPAAGAVAVAAAVLCFLYYYYMSKKNFGGITGDLAGWFLQICELAMLVAVVGMQVI